MFFGHGIFRTSGVGLLDSGFGGCGRRSQGFGGIGASGVSPGNLNPTWTPKVCKIMAFKAIIKGLGLLFYILLGFGYAKNLESLKPKSLNRDPKPSSPYKLTITWGEPIP